MGNMGNHFEEKIKFRTNSYAGAKTKSSPLISFN